MVVAIYTIYIITSSKFYLESEVIHKVLYLKIMGKCRFIWYRRYSRCFLPKMNLTLREGAARTENASTRTYLEGNLIVKSKEDLIPLGIRGSGGVLSEGR